MPWALPRTLRTEKPWRNRRHSTLEPGLSESTGKVASSSEQPYNALQSDTHRNLVAPSPLRQSFEPWAVSDDPIADAQQNALLRAKETAPKRQRFSILVKRHVSDPQISTTARHQASSHVPPLPDGTFLPTAVPAELVQSYQKGSSISGKATHDQTHGSSKIRSHAPTGGPKTLPGHESKVLSLDSAMRGSLVNPNDSSYLKGPCPPPAYGDDATSSLALPVPRLSESSRSDGSSADHVYAQTTTHTVSTTTTLFRLPKRKKRMQGPLFPLPAKVSFADNSSGIGRSSIPEIPFDISTESKTSLRVRDDVVSDHSQLMQRQQSNDEVSDSRSPRHVKMALTSLDPAPSIASSMNTSLLPDTDDGIQRSTAIASTDVDTPFYQQAPSIRTSSSIGRASLSNLFGQPRIRQNSEPSSRFSMMPAHVPGTPVSTGSKSQSFIISREPEKLPARLEGDTAAKYLLRLEENVNRGLVAAVLSQSGDEFFRNVLRSYMRGFSFFGDPLDMSTRKLLMEVELPKETQQIDRVLQAFANRYHECNPGVYATPDEAYFIAFSILILHTDVFNKNNKNKMQKHDYTKNAKGQGVADDILECFYDNITYTPFIHVEDDSEMNIERLRTGKAKRSLFMKQSTDASGQPSREPVDPYNLILDDRLSSLRPSLKGVMELEEQYTYCGTTADFLDKIPHLYLDFFRYGTLQIISSRSRPEAFMHPETMVNPAGGHPGVVDIKVTKVGILWRKDTKKKKTRSPWQEWGAILTGAQLYLFRNVAWTKALMHQHDLYEKQTLIKQPIVFKPPVEQFKPDVLMSMENAVALQDKSYKKHKNAILFIRHGGLEEIFLADSEGELNDWLGKLNYAAAFRSAGVRIRGLSQCPSENNRSGDSKPDTQRPDHTLQKSFAMDYAEARTNYAERDLALEIQEARKLLIQRKVAEADELLRSTKEQLEAHLRNARHLQILAPIQNKTRESIVLAAGGMAAKIKWARIEFWRTKCRRDILAMDLEHEMSASKELHTSQDRGPHDSDLMPVNRRQEAHTDIMPSTLNISSEIRAGVVFDVRPSSQPSPSRSPKSADAFVSRRRSSFIGGDKWKGPWELPPLSFQPLRVPSESQREAENQLHKQEQDLRLASRRSTEFGHDLGTLRPNTRSSRSGKQAKAINGPENKSRRFSTSEKQHIEKTQRPGTPTRIPETENGDIPVQDPVTNEGRTKPRRSLHRTLRDTAPGSATSRSRKGRESASSVYDAEGEFPGADGGLTRTKGSFTVHGKKASVITFGSEWQGISPDDRLKTCKDILRDDGQYTADYNAETTPTRKTKAVPFERLASDS